MNNNGVNNNINTTPPQDVPVITGVVTNTPKAIESPQIVTKKSKITPVLLIIIVLLIGYIVYSLLNTKAMVNNLTYNCTPVSSAEETKKLDLNSTIVRDLYEKVYTDIREDYAEPNWDNNMRLYLAYRMIPEDKKYDSNCNLFNNQSMSPYKCEPSNTFTPKAFKQEELELQWKKLYGEQTPFTYQNVKLSYDCIGGYQYIADRKEYVQGYCSENMAPSIKADKKLIEATTNGNTVILKEEVKYSGTEGIEVPSYLKSGIYYYNFRLDMNYNYVLVSKTYEEKY